MLAGMGGVSYHRSSPRSPRPAASAASARRDDAATQMVDEIRATQALTDKPFGVDLLTALPDRMLAQRRAR